MERIAREHRVQAVVDSDAFHHGESWENPVIREPAPMMPGAQPHEIAEAINEDISAEDVRWVLLFNQDRLLEKQGENKYPKPKRTSLIRKSLPIAIRAHRDG